MPAAHVAQATYLTGNEAMQQLPTILTSSSHPVSACTGTIPSVSFSTPQQTAGNWKNSNHLKDDIFKP